MDQSVSDNFGYEPEQEREYFYCDSCNSLLPAPGFYCVQCEPPASPNPDPESGISFSQALIRIALLTLLFLVVAVFRLEINLMDVFQSDPPNDTQLKIADDEDFKIFFVVNSSFANLRSLPNMKTSKIVDTLSMGDQVEVLSTERGWSKVRSKSLPGQKPQTGWIASKLLDSEIK